MNIAELHCLPKKEKLRIIEMLWEDLAADADSIESPAWHMAELKKTEEHLRKGEDEVLDWQEVKTKLRNTHHISHV